MSTTTLASGIEVVGCQVNDYTSNMVDKYWPFALGISIFGGAAWFARGAIMGLFV